MSRNIIFAIIYFICSGAWTWIAFMHIKMRNIFVAILSGICAINYLLLAVCYLCA